MSKATYAYGVARIRAMEMSLFTSAVIEQLMALKSYESCLQFLEEKGWGGTDVPQDAEAILAAEREKTWRTVRELLGKDTRILDVFSYPNLFHNLKAAIKETAVSEKHGSIYYEDCSIGGKEMARIVAERDWEALPANMRDAAKEAYESFLHTKDGQLCDIIVDRAALTAVIQAGEEASDPIIRDYAESTAAIADIKIAVRSWRTGKSLDFMRRAMAECKTVSTECLSLAAMAGIDGICEYLEGTPYREGGAALKESTSAFERWCDNQIIETIRPQKYNPFSAGPIIAYMLARENEIKTVRIILTGKLNQLPDDLIRERVREMYV